MSSLNRPNKKVQEIIDAMVQEPEFNNLIERLRDSDKPENNGLALKIFSEFCCDSCSCKSESDHNQED